MLATQKLKKARVQLILDHPFFASIALRLEYIEDKQIPSTATNGKQVKYNPYFIESLPIKEIACVIAHEVLHICSLHHTRRSNRENRLWNKAADYAINPLLESAKFQLPKGALLHSRFQNMSAEHIYSMLKVEASNEEQGSNDQGIGAVEDLPISDNRQEVEAQIKHAMVQAAMVAKSQGNLPDFIGRMVSEAIQPKISWLEALHRFFSEITKSDYTWTKPSTRYLYRGLYLPALETPHLGATILIVDTSASISETKINSFAAEVQEITSIFNIPLIVIYVDTEVQGVQQFEPDEKIILHPIGGGGTDFIPGFEFINSHDLQPETIVYLTDGECYSFPPDPDCNVLWAQFGNFPFNPPFGEVIQITD
jgi:predicted metal-dependent peptidase